MKKVIIGSCMVIFLGMGLALADQSLQEKAAATSDNAQRSIDKTKHKAEEKTCDKTKAQCLLDQSNDRLDEAASGVKDKTKETVDKVDTNKTPTK